jgi:hypothetical protein
MKIEALGMEGMPAVTEKQRAAARTHVEKLRRQRQNPKEILEKLEREQPDGSITQLREYIEFNNKQLQSLVIVCAIPSTK